MTQKQAISYSHEIAFPLASRLRCSTAHCNFRAGAHYSDCIPLQALALQPPRHNALLVAARTGTYLALIVSTYMVFSVQRTVLILARCIRSRQLVVVVLRYVRSLNTRWKAPVAGFLGRRRRYHRAVAAVAATGGRLATRRERSFHNSAPRSTSNVRPPSPTPTPIPTRCAVG